LANTKSAIKNIRKSRRRAEHNKAIYSRAHTAVRNARKMIEAGKQEQAHQAIQAAYSALDKAAIKGVIHKNKAARHKSRLMERYNASFQPPE
jgi:small subunit ribosomal protein S20